MGTHTTVSPTHRLDKALFWLRWVFVAAAASLALLAEETVLGEKLDNHDPLLIVVGAAAVGNIVLGVLALVQRVGETTLGVLGVIFDSLLAVLFFWAYDGAAALLPVLGALAMLSAAYRFGWRGMVLAGLLLAAGSALVESQLDQPGDDQLVNWALTLGFLLALGMLGSVMRRSGGADTAKGRAPRLSLDERESEALQLRSARERTRAIYEMANTLSANLDHQHVLEAAQMIGALALREDLGDDVRLISAVLLFQGKENMLRARSARGLTRADLNVTVPGHRGILGLALKQTTPVFGADATRDPELRFFAGFTDIKSVLAIPLRAQFDNFGVMVFGCDHPNAFSDEHVELMTAIGTQSTMALQNAVLYQNLLTEKEKIVEVEEDARKKLARDLHDGPTQSVAAIAMRVNFIRRLVERQPQQAIEELWKVEELARRTTKEIRHMLFTLRPLVLETQGLVAALQQLAEKMLETHNTKVTVKAQKEIENHLDTNAQGVLFYIVEEAVNNARKHSQAEEIIVRLYRREAFVMVEIEDNGVGFDVSAVDANYDQRGSLGMINMRERAELVEGQLRIQSAKGMGTKISVMVPVQAGSGPVADGAAPAPAPLALQSQRDGSVAAQPRAAESRPDNPLRAAPPPQPPLASESRPDNPLRNGARPPAPTDPRLAAPPATNPPRHATPPHSPTSDPPSRLRRPERPIPRSPKPQD